MKTAIIAEKPSVAREIAAIVGATAKKDGYIQGNGYIVTWAFGHLVGLAMPDDYGFTGFSRERLPIMPEQFILRPRQVKGEKGYATDAGALKQLNIIKEVFDKCDKIIVATDAGREGELIFRYIYDYLKCSKPFDRLWISSLTDKAIREGLQNLKEGRNYDNLFYAAKARSEADWLVGINASQALSIVAGHGTFSLGRVQTPTLAMICKRYWENKNFVPVPYWQVRLQTEHSNVPFAALSQEKYEDKAAADAVHQLLQTSKTVCVQSIEKREVSQEPPLLYDLTSLQKEMNSKHGFSADKTLSIAQKLYEIVLITYPRTGSRYIPEDVFEGIYPLLSGLWNNAQYGWQSVEMNKSDLNRRAVDDKKVTDHHALLITGNVPKELSADEVVVYTRIAGRMLESFSKKCIKDTTTILLSCGDAVFGAKGSTVEQAGWLKVFNEPDESREDEAGRLPALVEGEQLPVTQCEVLAKQTRPKPIHTESSLLSSMESAGKEVESETEREAMRESGIGTPATRAAVIETLFSRDYVRRDNKSLVPTEKGLAVFDAVKDKKIADVAMTGNWESALCKIETGEIEGLTFHAAIEVYTRQITTELLGIKFTISDANLCLCPKCNKGQMQFYNKAVKCNNEDCLMTIFRNKSDKMLSDEQVTDLLTKGKTPVIRGFKSKGGKVFDASLTFDKQFQVVFVFAEKKGTFEFRKK
jgi:DNA topoisomerase-3